MTLNNRKTQFSRSRYTLTRISHKRLKIRPQLLWKTNRKPHPCFRMVPVWMTSSDFQGHDDSTSNNLKMIQHRPSTTVLSLQWPTNKKSYDLSNDLERRFPQFQGHAVFYAEYLRNGTTYRHRFNEILIGTYTYPTQQCHFEWFWVTLSDLAKYSMTRSVARSFCDSWVSCFKLHKKIV